MGAKLNHKTKIFAMSDYKILETSVNGFLETLSASAIIIKIEYRISESDCSNTYSCLIHYTDGFKND